QRRRHSAARLLMTSIAESKPNPASAILPARNPATSAARHSSEFHAMVTYCSQRPRCATAARSFATSAIGVFVTFTWLARPALHHLPVLQHDFAHRLHHLAPHLHHPRGVALRSHHAHHSASHHPTPAHYVAARHHRAHPTLHLLMP